MTLREAVLDSLSDDSETIVQIKEYLNFLSIKFNEQELLIEISKLYNEKLIKIIYPKDFKEIKFYSTLQLEQVWFAMTEKGIDQWNEINL